MTETRTEVKDPTGFVHTGTGDIVVNLRESVARRVRGSRLVPRDDVSWLRRRFADPEHLGSARDKLLLNRTLLLAGPPGSGRRTAAKILLNEHTDDDVPFEVLAEDDRLDQVQVDVRHRLLLDLSAADAETFRARQRELPAFRTALHQRDAYLVVVLPDSLDHQVDAEFAHHVAAIGRPDGRTALRRHLEAEDVWPAKHDLDAAGLDAHLSGPMRDIAALARLVVQARDSGRGDGVAGWLREAVEAVAERGREVADQLADHQAGRARTLLLAAAMCRGAPADAVFFASHRLVEMLGLGAGEKPRLEQDGYRSQLSALEIDVSEDDRIGFRRFAYDRAVRAHFWDNYPDLRWQFRQWVDHLVRRVPLGREDRENLVERYVAEALRTGTPEHVVSLVDEWVKPGSGAGPRYLVDLGVQALVLGLRDERHGRRFRRLVYDWSRDGELPAGVGQLVVHACTEVIAPTFPNQALVRLHHRARREDGTGDPTALQALRDLVSRNRGLLAVLLDRLVEAFARQERWYADLVLFLDIAEPWRLASAGRGTPLVAQSWVRQRLVFGWSVVLRHQPDSAQGVVHSWLDAAGRIDRPDLLLGVLVEAASPDVGQLARLYVTARDWAASGRGRPEVVARLSELIDTAQGIRPGDFTYRPAVEETVG